MRLQIIIKCGKNQLSFTGRDYYFLSKAHDMVTQGNVMINRAAHESKTFILLNRHLIEYLRLLNIYHYYLRL